jgi:hypothetical protein
MDKQAEKRAEHALDYFRSSLNDLVVQAGAVPSVLADSAFVFGYSTGMRDEEGIRTLHKAPKVLRLLRDVSACLAVAGEEELRNKVDEFVKDAADSAEKAVLLSASMLYGVSVGALLCSRSPSLTDAEAFEVGMSCATRDPSMFSGFVMLMGDKRLTCHCPTHLSEGARMLGVRSEELVPACVRKYGDQPSAVMALGRHVKDHFSSLILDATGGGHPVSEGEAVKEFHGLMDRIHPSSNRNADDNTSSPQ